MKLFRALIPVLALSCVSTVSFDADASFCKNYPSFCKKIQAWRESRTADQTPKDSSSSTSSPSQAPELNASGAPVGLALALGGALVLAGRRRKAVSG